MPLKRFPRVIAIVAVGLFMMACWMLGPDPLRPSGMMDWGHYTMMGPVIMYQWRQPPAGTPAPTVTPGGNATVSYRLDIQPIFNRLCVSCHGGQAGLYLDSYDHLIGGSGSGSIVIPGDPKASELVRRIQGISQPRMPPGGSPLPASDIDNIVTWITEGCPNN